MSKKKNQTEVKDFDFDSFEAEVSTTDEKIEHLEKKSAKTGGSSSKSQQTLEELTLDQKIKRVMFRWVLPLLGTAIVFMIVGVVIAVFALSGSSSKSDLPEVELKSKASVLDEVADMKDSQISMLQKQITALSDGSKSSTISAQQQAELMKVHSDASKLAGEVFSTLLAQEPSTDENVQASLKASLEPKMDTGVADKLLSGKSPVKDLKTEITKIGSPVLGLVAINSDGSRVYVVNVAIASNDQTYTAEYVMSVDSSGVKVANCQYVGLVKSEEVADVAKNIESMQN